MSKSLSVNRKKESIDSSEKSEYKNNDFQRGLSLNFHQNFFDMNSEYERKNNQRKQIL